MISHDVIKRIKKIYLERIIDDLRSGISREIVVEGYSMIPTLEPGIRVKIHPCTIYDVKVGQIIAYKLLVNPWITVHRAVAKSEQDRTVTIITKGDHMKKVDGYIITSESFLGIVEIIK